MADTYIESDEAETDEATETLAIADNPTDRAIERAFEQGRFRINQERNDFFLLHVLDFIKGRQWGNLSPEYQRRLRWNNEKKSRLIESLLMNIPIPPVFLYDTRAAKLEVLDGQQRINAIVEFLSDKLELEKLKIWPDLNGRTYAKLPPAVRRGLERSKLSAVTLQTEAIKSKGSQIDLRAQVFDRLNTGGEKLNPQELRNCLYSGTFNKLIVELAASSKFTKAWGIPNHKNHTLSDGSYDEILKNNKLFSTMADCQIVLRFFAFKDPTFIVGSTRNILDSCMERQRNLSDAGIKALRAEFTDSLDTAINVFGDRAFRVGQTSTSKGRLSRPLFDAQMVAINRLAQHKTGLIAKKAVVSEAILALTQETNPSYETIVGRPNTSLAIKSRIDVVESAMLTALS